MPPDPWAPGYGSTSPAERWIQRRPTLTGRNTELLSIMDSRSLRPPCARPGERKARSNRPAIVAATSHNRASMQHHKQMDIMANLRIDRGRMASRIVSDKPRIPAQSLSQSGDATDQRLRPAIVSSCGINRRTTQEKKKPHIAAVLREDRFRLVLRESPKTPGNSSMIAWRRKKTRIAVPSRVEKPCNTQVFRSGDRPKRP